MAVNQKQVLEAFTKWFIAKALAAGKDPQAMMQELGEEGMKQAYLQFVKEMQGQVRRAEYGAKLDYIKKIKGDCPDGQLMVFFKKGGRICKACQGKKLEQGGPAKKKLNAVQQFKLDRATRDSIAANKYNDLEVQATKPGSYKKNKQGKVQWTPDRNHPYYKNK